MPRNVLTPPIISTLIQEGFELSSVENQQDTCDLSIINFDSIEALADYQHALSNQVQEMKEGAI